MFEFTIRIHCQGSVTVQGAGDRRLAARHGCDAVLELARMIDQMELIYAHEVTNEVWKRVDLQRDDAGDRSIDRVAW